MRTKCDKLVKVILECAKGNINKHAVQAGVRQVRDQVGWTDCGEAGKKILRVRAANPDSSHKGWHQTIYNSELSGVWKCLWSKGAQFSPHLNSTLLCCEFKGLLADPYQTLYRSIPTVEKNIGEHTKHSRTFIPITLFTTLSFIKHLL